MQMVKEKDSTQNAKIKLSLYRQPKSLTNETVENFCAVVCDFFYQIHYLKKNKK